MLGLSCCWCIKIIASFVRPLRFTLSFILFNGIFPPKRFSEKIWPHERVVQLTELKSCRPQKLESSRQRCTTDWQAKRIRGTYRLCGTMHQTASHENSETSLQLYDLFIQGSQIRLKYITLHQAKDNEKKDNGKKVTDSKL